MRRVLRGEESDMGTVSSEIRWGVLGFGQIAADRGVPGLVEARGARWVAVADSRAERLKLARSQRNDLSTYADYRELLTSADMQVLDAVAESAVSGRTIELQMESVI
jgi:hypothetical protein